MPFGIIYKAVNKINNKPYIGQTISSLEERVSKHFYDGRARKGRDNSIFHKALIKYGKDGFTWEVVCECISKEDLDEKETYYIIKTNSHYLDGYGYNMTYGGEGSFGYKHTESALIKMRNRVISDEQKKLLSSIRLGRKDSEETRRKKSEAGKGRIVSDETKEKLRKANTGKKHTKETKRKLSERYIGEETKRKMSLSRMGISPWNKGKEITPTKLWLDSQEKSHSKTYEVNNNGNISQVTNLSKYCRLLNINMSGLRSAYRKGLLYRGISLKLVDNPNNLVYCIDDETNSKQTP